MHPLKHAASACALTTLALIGVDAFAAPTIRIDCEARGSRSKISVDGKGLAAGSYSTQVISGGNVATHAPVAAVAGQIETDYDSNAADIKGGAAAVVPGFIVGGQVSGKIVDAAGNTVIADTAACRVRSR